MFDNLKLRAKIAATKVENAKEAHDTKAAATKLKLEEELAALKQA